MGEGNLAFNCMKLVIVESPTKAKTIAYINPRIKRSTVGTPLLRTAWISTISDMIVDIT